jgi:hypothetical protein
VRVLEADGAAPRRLEPLRRRLGQVLEAAYRRQRRERLRLAVEELGQAPPANRIEQRVRSKITTSLFFYLKRKERADNGQRGEDAYVLDRELRHEGGHLEVGRSGPRRAGVVGELHIVRRRGEARRRAADVLILFLASDDRLLAAREQEVGLHCRADHKLRQHHRLNKRTMQQ